jgi:hypothetical protein
MSDAPAYRECAYCGKPLNYEQRKSGGRYCEAGHANKHRRWPSIQAEWDEMNAYLETRDQWERTAPQMHGKPAEIRDWHIRQVMREEMSRGLSLGRQRR